MEMGRNGEQQDEKAEHAETLVDGSTYGSARRVPKPSTGIVEATGNRNRGNPLSDKVPLCQPGRQTRRQSRAQPAAAEEGRKYVATSPETKTGRH